MKEILKRIFRPYKVIIELEEEIRNQDTQYNGVCVQNSKLKKQVDYLENENQIITEQKDKYLSKIKELRKELKEVKK
jgi:peptidoglycan hydrolase CwlO-like protein